MQSTSQPPAVSIVIPAYNEERRLPQSIRDLSEFFRRMNDSGAVAVEILIIVEKSTDRTVERAREAAAGSPISIIANDVQRGKGYAVRTGMLRARGEIVFFMDADLSTPLSEVFNFLATFQSEPAVDIIIGSRAEAKSQILKRQTWFRQNLGRGFNRFVQLFAIDGIRDTQCGFKAFRRATIEPIFSRQTLNGFAFDVEVLLLAQKLGYTIKTLPVRWVNSPDSKVRIWIDPILMLRDLIAIRWIVRRSLKARPPDPKSSPSS